MLTPANRKEQIAELRKALMKLRGSLSRAALAGIFAPPGEIVLGDEALVLPRVSWTKAQYMTMARRYEHAVRQNQKKLDALKAEYSERFHEQLELWPS